MPMFPLFCGKFDSSTNEARRRSGTTEKFESQIWVTTCVRQAHLRLAVIVLSDGRNLDLRVIHGHANVPSARACEAL